MTETQGETYYRLVAAQRLLKAVENGRMPLDSLALGAIFSLTWQALQWHYGLRP